MRGEHTKLSSKLLNRARFIPACAGNTSLSGLEATSFGGSSPHARGTRSALVTNCDISSVHPRMRGEHLHSQAQNHQTHRFIPACAGNTQLCSRFYAFCWRSSPHARGTHSSLAALPLRYRFIPACAGNTLPYSFTIALLTGSSPHARGTPNEGYKELTLLTVHPRMRGEHTTMQPILCVLLAFIPACAGNTLFSSGVTVMLSVHPRMRGEHFAVFFYHCPFDRFIPACAGNTNPTRQCSCIITGSSPHARGTHTLLRKQDII